jgi:hypothetical protein
MGLTAMISQLPRVLAGFEPGFSVPGKYEVPLRDAARLKFVHIFACFICASIFLNFSQSGQLSSLIFLQLSSFIFLRLEVEISSKYVFFHMDFKASRVPQI